VITTVLFSAILVVAALAQLIKPDLLNVRPIAFVTLGITALIGVVLTALGIVAMYVARIHAEVVRRPLYVVREEFSDSTSHQTPPAVSAREQYR
jgi:dolichol-phosphate mannosyltransferase